MYLTICSLNSGSNGNCYYVGNDTEAVLIDVGISCRAVELRMKSAGLNINRVKAIFISHEHTDHISGVASLAAKYSLPVYATEKTCNSCSQIPRSASKYFSTTNSTVIGSLEIVAFSKYHDAADPHSFIIRNGSTCVGVFTDLGRPCKELTKHFGQCDAAFLEANYDVNMLASGRYPIFLKNRIRNGRGHLSNDEALDVFVKHRSPRLSHLLLSHLSAQNNCPELVTALFAPHAGNTSISIASRYAVSPVLCIGSSDTSKVFPSTGGVQLRMEGFS